MFKFNFRRLRGSRHSNTSSTEIHEEGAMPNGGAIPNQEILSNKGSALGFERPLFHSPQDSTLTVLDIIKTIVDNYEKARLILAETGHLNRARFAVKQNGSTKTRNDARALDQALYKAKQELTETSTIEASVLNINAKCRAAQSAKFRETWAIAVRTLRRLEKKLRGDIIDELMAGLIDKKEVDHAQLRFRVDKIHTEVCDVCAAVVRIYEYNLERSIGEDLLG